MPRREHPRAIVLILGVAVLAVIPPAFLAHSLATVTAPESAVGVDLSWIKDISVTGVLGFLGLLTFKLLMRAMDVWAEARKTEAGQPSARASDFTALGQAMLRIEKLLERQADELGGIKVNLALFNDRLGNLIQLINARP